ncbi:MAG: hypothetical protein OEV44_04570, partial [Spirochaetota bacterium]|nr:hypothetical protein [Spirochaetota bacterium]
RMSWQWWVILHSPIPFIIFLRITLDIEYYYIPIVILVAVLGQLIGSRPVRKYIQNNIKRNRDSESV